MKKGGVRNKTFEHLAKGEQENLLRGWIFQKYTFILGDPGKRKSKIETTQWQGVEMKHFEIFTAEWQEFHVCWTQ